jgi:hypothetical protein
VLEGLGHPAGAHGGAVAAPGAVGQPRGRAAGTAVDGDVVGHGQHPQQQRLEADGRAGELEEGLRSLRGRHQHRLGRRGLVHRGVHAVGARQRRVGGAGRELFQRPR